MADSDKPLGQRNYERFADRFATIAPTKPANALYERPATQSLLPDDLSGLEVLDAGCGPGIYAEWLARRGARVHAVDVTPEMVELCRERTAGLAVEACLGDLARPLDWLGDGRFDLVLSPLALDYIADWRPVFAEFYRVSKPGGLLVFSVQHPLWDWSEAGTRAYYEVELFDWLWKGFGDPQPVVTAYRRPLGAVFNPLIEAGWIMERILEPRPSDAYRAADPAFYEKLARAPFFLCVRARRA